MEADSGNGYAPGWGMLLMMMGIAISEKRALLPVADRDKMFTTHECKNRVKILNLTKCRRD